MHKAIWCAAFAWLVTIWGLPVIVFACTFCTWRVALHQRVKLLLKSIDLFIKNSELCLFSRGRVFIVNIFSGCLLILWLLFLFNRLWLRSFCFISNLSFASNYFGCSSELWRAIHVVGSLSIINNIYFQDRLLNCTFVFECGLLLPKLCQLEILWTL